MSRQIVWDDLDKKKYYFWGCTVFLGIRVCVYPTNLVKTRLQVQKGTDVYRGSFDAFLKVCVRFYFALFRNSLRPIYQTTFYPVQYKLKFQGSKALNYLVSMKC